MKVQGRGQGTRRKVTFGAIAVGALFLTIGLVMTWVSVSFVTDAKHAQGTVVGLEWRKSENHSTSRKSKSDNEPAAYPTVRFTSADGATRTFENSTGSKPPAYDVGERVEVLYRAEAPADAQINGFVSLWLMPLVFTGIGLAVTVIGTVVAVKQRRRA